MGNGVADSEGRIAHVSAAANGCGGSLPPQIRGVGAYFGELLAWKVGWRGSIVRGCELQPTVGVKQVASGSQQSNLQ